MFCCFSTFHYYDAYFNFNSLLSLEHYKGSHRFKRICIEKIAFNDDVMNIKKYIKNVTELLFFV
ncbi:hypothetical protein L289_2480 [Acinetobacter gerneri DSM 14967 = CIP 107464 = MTCC 9824]|nr:hypothetical protein L289_2480 [Acinetobacter gerneri DSM 14967 = CIP 107464 = MTCC 9824]